MKKGIILTIFLLSFYSINCFEYFDLLSRAASKLYEPNYDQYSYSQIAALGDSYEILKKNLIPLFKELDDGSSSIPDVSQKCLVQGYTLLNGLKSNETWAIKVIDALGKPESGFIEGSLNWLGSYSECINSVDETVDWSARYCTASKPAYLRKPIDFTPSVGFCLPEKCNSHDVLEIINFGINNIPENITKFINLTNLTIDYITCKEPAKVDGAAIFTILVISALLLLTLIGTIYDIYKEKEKKVLKEYEKKISEVGFKNKLAEAINETDNSKTNVPNTEQQVELKFNKQEEPLFLQIILCFSLYTNLRKLFTINKSGDQLDCVHCIRFFSMSWVVLGHTLAFILSFSKNPVTLMEWQQRFSFMMVNSGLFAVDSFFFLSGLLNSYLFMKEIKKRNFKFDFDLFFKYYIHRLWRITPPYMLVLMFSACLTSYLGSGPYYPIDEGLEPNCRTNWWINLLYINNLVETKKMCYGICWYLANDMQFYWIAPLMLVPLALGLKNKIMEYAGVAFSTLLIVINVLVISLLLNSHPNDIDINSPWFGLNIYLTPWCRIGPFIVGILAGYYIYKCKNNPNFNLKNSWNFLGWLVSFFVLGLMTFGTFPNFNANPDKHLNNVENILYQATSRTIWSLALAWIIFSCVMKKGGFMNDIFCWPVWTPLSRLSFSAYLIHYDVIYYYYGSQETTFFVKEINMSYIFVSNMVFSYAAALVVSMLFEVPLLGLEKFVFGKKK